MIAGMWGGARAVVVIAAVLAGCAAPPARATASSAPTVSVAPAAPVAPSASIAPSVSIAPDPTAALVSTIEYATQHDSDLLLHGLDVATLRAIAAHDSACRGAAFALMELERRKLEAPWPRIPQGPEIAPLAWALCVRMNDLDEKRRMQAIREVFPPSGAVKIEREVCVGAVREKQKSNVTRKAATRREILPLSNRLRCHAADAGDGGASCASESWSGQGYSFSFALREGTLYLDAIVEEELTGCGH